MKILGAVLIIVAFLFLCIGQVRIFNELESDISLAYEEGKLNGLQWCKDAIENRYVILNAQYRDNVNK